MKKKHGNRKLYHNLNTRQNRKRLNDIASKIIAECMPNEYETSSNIMNISPDIAARVMI